VRFRQCQTLGQISHFLISCKIRGGKWKLNPVLYIILVRRPCTHILNFRKIDNPRVIYWWVNKFYRPVFGGEKFCSTCSEGWVKCTKPSLERTYNIGQSSALETWMLDFRSVAPNFDRHMWESNATEVENGKSKPNWAFFTPVQLGGRGVGEMSESILSVEPLKYFWRFWRSAARPS